MSLSNKIQAFKSSEQYQNYAKHIRGMIILAEKIYGRRKDLGLTQAELADKMGVKQKIISQLESANYALKIGLTEETYDKLAFALEIDRDYFFSEKIDRKTFELFAYIKEILKKKLDIMQFMKIPYFVDIESIKKLGSQLTNFLYIRYNFGPFDSKIYAYKGLFDNIKYKIQYSYLSDYFEIINETLKEIPVNNGKDLKKLSYLTAPMKKIGAKLGGIEHMGEPLDMYSVLDKD